MTSLFDVGKSALNSYRQSLAVTGQNIANINTEGYKKREANLRLASRFLYPSVLILALSLIHI